MAIGNGDAYPDTVLGIGTGHVQICVVDADTARVQIREVFGDAGFGVGVHGARRFNEDGDLATCQQRSDEAQSL